MEVTPRSSAVLGMPQGSSQTTHVSVTVKLGSTLRDKAPALENGLGVIELAARPSPRVTDVMEALGIDPDEVRLIYLNHVLVGPEARINEGDRVALFPPLFVHFSQFYLKRRDE